MRHLFPALLFLGILAPPALAESPSVILTEAAETATAIDDLDDRRRALEPVIEAYATLGEPDLALALIRAETELSIHGSLWAAFIEGQISGPGPATALNYVEQIPDRTDRDLALRDIIKAFIRAEDMPSALSTFALMPPGPLADFAASDVAKAWLDAGNDAEALAVANAISDVRWRESARLDYVAYLVTNGRLDEALAQMPSFGPDWPRETAQVLLVAGLARAGRLPEAEAIITMATQPRTQFRGRAALAAVAAGQGDLDLARAWLAGITDESEWQTALSRSVSVVAHDQGATAALDFLASVPEFPDTQYATRDRILSSAVIGLVYDGHIGPARELLPAIAGTPEFSRTLSTLVVLRAGDDIATARADLDAIIDPADRFDAILAILNVTPEADDEDSLIAEALAHARAIGDPDQRSRALARLSTAIGP